MQCSAKAMEDENETDEKKIRRRPDMGLGSSRLHSKERFAFHLNLFFIKQLFIFIVFFSFFTSFGSFYYIVRSFLCLLMQF